jgi:hypothetical protein
MQLAMVMACLALASGCRERRAPAPAVEGPMSRSDAGPSSSTTTRLPTLASELEGVSRMIVRPVQGVIAPFRFTRTAEITGADLKALIAAMGPDQIATDGRPRCLTALSAELVRADGSRKGYLDLYCAAGTPTPVPVILGSVREVSWMFADPAAGQALLERLGN